MWLMEYKVKSTILTTLLQILIVNVHYLFPVLIFNFFIFEGMPFQENIGQDRAACLLEW